MSDFWLNHLSSVLSREGLVAYRWDADGDDLHWAGEVRSLLNAEEGDCPQNAAAYNRLLNPQDLPVRLTAVHGALAGDPLKISYRIRRADGSQATVEETASLGGGKKDGARILYGAIRILSAGDGKARSADGAATAEVHGGRRSICRALEQWADSSSAGEEGPHGYLLAVGIDRLTLMNEAFGALYTDELIEKTGARLREIVGAAAQVARINGDVYSVFFPRGPHNEMASVARHLLDCFYEAPLVTTQGHASVGVSIGGIAVTARECRDIPTLLARSEMAMQVAKERGRGCFVSYDEAAGYAARNRTMLTAGDEFLRAMKQGRVRLAFQPVMNFARDEVSFHECLIRMIDEEGKLRPASSFVPAIEHLGMSRLVDQYAMKKAIHELGQFPDLNLSVNVSALSLTSPEWLRGLVGVLRNQPSVARRLIIEITEGMVMKDTAQAVRVVRTLKDLGCRVALDDFGAGFTAFSQLRDMALDIVKIDKSFVRNIGDRKNHLFLKTLQTLAEGINVETVGEGAETLEDARILADVGVGHVQGYAFGFPCVERIWLPKGHAFRHVDETEGQGGSANRPGATAPLVLPADSPRIRAH